MSVQQEATNPVYGLGGELFFDDGHEKPLRLESDVALIGSAMLELDQTAVEDVEEIAHATHEVWHDPETLRVHVKSSLTLADYERAYEQAGASYIWHGFLRQVEEFKETGRTIVRGNATPLGGGVAIMNAKWLHLMELCGVDAEWYAMEKNTEASKVTKFKFHNALQDNVPEGETGLNGQDIVTYEAWADEFGEKLRGPLSRPNLAVIIDDWQPHRLAGMIKGRWVKNEHGVEEWEEGINPGAIVCFRDHIQTVAEKMVEEGTPAHRAWDYIRRNLGWRPDKPGFPAIDVFITHPVDSFVPPDLPDDLVAFMPAVYDTLDDLNRPLNQHEIDKGMTEVNACLIADGQEPLDLTRPYDAQVARFDESKGIDLLINAYAATRKRMEDIGLPRELQHQLLIIGNTAQDDPSYAFMLEQTKHWASQYPEYSADIKIACMPHNDVALNAVMSHEMAEVGWQLSTKEGFEDRASHWHQHGRPANTSIAGGLPLQQLDGVSGYVHDPHDAEFWAEKRLELALNPDMRSAMREAAYIWAEEHHMPRLTTATNAASWLHMITTIHEQGKYDGNREWVSERIYPNLRSGMDEEELAA